VRIATTLLELDKLLSEAEKSCAVVFFISNTCGYCKKLYPLYEELAVGASHKATMIVVDILRAADAKKKYAVRDTPTFISFLCGVQENRWSGSDPETLRGNINLLIDTAWPPHPHKSLHLPALLGANTKPVLYSKIPPLGKLKSKMGHVADEAAITGVLHFVSARAADGPNEATLPDLDAFSRFLHSAPTKLPPEVMFTIVDLMRLALVDPRFSGYYAEEKDHATVAPLISYVNSIKDCPYSLRLVALQLACNLFSTPLYPIHILSCPTLRSPIVQLITTSLLDDQNHIVRVAAASLSFNMAAASSKLRTDEHLESLPEGDQVELAASLLEAIEQEKASPEALKGFLLALGYIIFCTPRDGEMVDLLKIMDAQGTVLSKKKLFPEEPLIEDVGEVLIGKVLE
jgi:thiol-disulfide isomerase/thioredoxin